MTSKSSVQFAAFVFSFFILHPSIASNTTPDNTAIFQYLMMRDNKTLITDNVEHGQCGYGLFSPWNPDANNGSGAGSTCKTPDPYGEIWPGLIEAISVANPPSGNKVYKLPALPPANWNGIDNIGIHTAKFSSAHPAILAAQAIGSQNNSTVRYSAFYYIESGFDDFADTPERPWHLQMQWKVLEPAYGDENPKIAWGFVNLPNETGDYIRQVQLTIREPTLNVCGINFQTFTRTSTLNLPPLPVPAKSWIKVTIEIKFDYAQGHVKIWQRAISDGTDTLVVNVSNINTINQIIKKCTNSACTDVNLGTHASCIDTYGNRQFWTNYHNFSFGVINYMSTSSYKPQNKYGSGDHVILVDDTEIKLP